jgi:hypothetical protein
VYFKESSDADYKLLKQDLTESFTTIDGISLSDGSYTIRVVAKDSPDNAGAISLTGEKISDPFDIDNTQPAVTPGNPVIAGQSAQVTFSASDRSSYITRAEYSVNGREWIAVYPDDGISDSPTEHYTVKVPMTTPGEYAVTLRVFDASGNAGNARAVVRR